MMQPPIFVVDTFRDPEDRPRSRRILLWLMEALIQADLQWLLQHPLTPALYDSPVQYKNPGQREWLDIPNVIREGGADCKSLAAWRVAELRNAGIMVQPLVRWPDDNQGRHHALVLWPDGRVEDPSLAMGMRGPIVRRPVFVAPYKGERP